MVRIEILEIGPGEDEAKTKRRIEIDAIDPSQIPPVNQRAGSLIAMPEIEGIIDEITPMDQGEDQELYYARNVPVLEDGNLARTPLDLPHHTGLRVVLESILREYGTPDNLQIRLS